MISRMEVQFVGHASRLWWDGVCDICKFRLARTGIKGVISALLLLHLLLHSRTERTSVLMRQVREKKRDRTGSKQLKGFSHLICLYPFHMELSIISNLPCQILIIFSPYILIDSF